jgi:DNA-binding transcriptional regulator YhcF (GntR family)
MIYGLGPRARRVYSILRDRIARGELAPGARLSSHRELAAEFGVAPLTVRQVLGELEDQGLVSRQVGRGTFVRQEGAPAILLLVPDAQLAAFLADYVRQAGYRALVATGQAEALAALSGDVEVQLVVADAHLPTPAEAALAIKAIRARRPALPLAIIATGLDDLAELFGTLDWPIHVLPTPINLCLLDELLRLTARRAPPSRELP